MGKLNTKKLMKELNATKTNKMLSESDNNIIDKYVKQVSYKHFGTQYTKNEQDAKIKLEVRSLIGREGIKLQTNQYNKLMKPLIEKYRAEYNIQSESLKDSLKKMNTQDSLTSTTVTTETKTNESEDGNSKQNHHIDSELNHDATVSSYKKLEPKLPTMNKPTDKTVYSRGEKDVAMTLESLNIPYEHEATVEGLVSEGDCTHELPCDFVISVNGKIAMIEYNGEHHYTALNEVLKYTRQVTNDLRRVNFALDNGIPYLVINCADTQKISNIIPRFITDIINERQEPTKYTRSTYGYFAEYSTLNDKLHNDIFNTSIPKLKESNGLSYMEVNADTILIWEKDKLLTMLSENKRLHQINASLYTVNGELKKQLVDTNKALVNTMNQLAETMCSNENEKANEPETNIKDDNEVVNTCIPVDKIITMSDYSIKIPGDVRISTLTQGKKTPKVLQEFINTLPKEMTIDDIHTLLKTAGIQVSLPTIKKYR